MTDEWDKGMVHNDEKNSVERVERADVLVFYSHEDEYRISKTILSYLGEKNIRYIHPDLDFIPGRNEDVDIAKVINRSKKILIIMSKQRKEHIQFSLETYLALEQEMRTTQMTLVILLLDGMRREDVPNALPMLKHACQIELVDNMHERCIEDLCRIILSPPATMTSLLPAGNFAVGMAWSHFSGYLKLMLPALADAIRKTNHFKDNIGRMSTCFFILCPLSGRGSAKISDEDDDVEFVGCVRIPGTYFNPSIYKVKKKQNNGEFEEYFACAEYPSAMLTVGTICDEALSLLSPEQRRIEVERFKYKTEELINHSNSQGCHGSARCILFDDEGKSDESLPSFQLMRAAKETISEWLGRSPDESMKRQVSRNQAEGKKTDVCFLYCYIQKDELNILNGTDHSTVSHIMMNLEEKGLTCTTARLPIETPAEIETRIRSSRWIAVLLSKESLKTNDMISIWLVSILKLCIEENRFRIMVLLRNLGPEDIPDFIQWVTYIDIGKEKDYIDRLMEIVQGRNVSMDSQVPVGDVYFGLAWAFHVNYLRHILPDLDERIDEKLSSGEIQQLCVGKQEIKRSAYLLVIVPQSSTFVKHLSDIDDKIEGPYEAREVQKGIQIFTLRIYRIQTFYCDYFFAGEVFTPVRTLKAMHDSPIGGMSRVLMDRQRDKTVQQLKAILESSATPQNMQKKCKLIQYNDEDKRKALSEVIIDEIESEGMEEMVTKYGDWLKTQ